MYIHTYTCINTYIHVYTHNTCVYVHTYIHAYTHTYIHACIHTLSHKNICPIKLLLKTVLTGGICSFDVTFNLVNRPDSVSGTPHSNTIYLTALDVKL